MKKKGNKRIYSNNGAFTSSAYLYFIENSTILFQNIAISERYISS